jgi:hypothetical protein
MPRGSELNEVDFVKFWQTCEDTEELCEKAGMSWDVLRIRANYYRRKGVPLKYYGNHYNKDFKALAELAASLNTDTTEKSARRTT